MSPSQPSTFARAQRPFRRYGRTGALLLVMIVLAAGSAPARRAGADPAPQLSINDVSVTEGDSGATSMFTVSLVPTAAAVVTVDFATANGSAVGGSDFVLSAGTLTFNPGESVKPILVTINGDNLAEGNETFTVNLSGAVGAGISDAAGTATIVDDDVASSMSINDLSVAEGGAARFEVSMFPASSQTVTVAFSTANGTAAAPEDYDSRAGVLTFSPGERTKAVEIATRTDHIQEGSETFTVALSGAGNATISDPTGTATILDNDVVPTVSINDDTVTEGGEARFTVSLLPAASQTVTVAYNTANGSAVSPDDYNDRAGVLTFSPGERTKTVTVDTHGDPVPEGAETFSVLLSNAANATISDPAGVATIQDTDLTPSLTIDDIEVIEGDVDYTPATFTVKLFPPSKQRVSVEYFTANSSATSPEDYLNKAGVLVFKPGETTKQITVRVTADEIDELPEDQRFLIVPGVAIDTTNTRESYTVTLVNAVNARIADPNGVGSIVDDDLTPAFTINDVTDAEGGVDRVPGLHDAVFTVTLFPFAAEEDVTVEFTTFSTTAFTGEDFLPVGGTLLFTPGETVHEIRVPILGDLNDEPDETYGITLTSAHNAKLYDGQGVGVIVDDDLGPAFVVNDVAVLEGSSGDADAVFTVSLTEPSDKVASVEVATLDDLATSPADYLAARGVLSFAPGVLSQQVRVPIVGDTLEEPDETFKLVLVNANVAVADGEATGIIIDNDSAAAPRVALVPTPTGKGYWIAADDGDIFPFGDAQFYGSVSVDNARRVPRGRLNRPIVGMAATPTGRGYWMVASDGGVFAFGNARFLGSTGAIKLNRPIVAMAATASGLGYWMVASDGGIFAFGDAQFFGSTGAYPLEYPIVGMSATPTGRGYWLVASDGGVFAFGDTRFLGSTGGRPLNHPVVGLVPTPSGRGYWLVATDGGVFNFGDAQFLNSMGSVRLQRPITNMASSPSGNGYWMVATDGGVFTFGDAAFFGSTGGVRPPPSSSVKVPR